MAIRTVTPSSDLPPPAGKSRLNQLSDLEAKLPTWRTCRSPSCASVGSPLPTNRCRACAVRCCIWRWPGTPGRAAWRLVAQVRAAPRLSAGKGAAAQAAVPGMRLVREWNGQLHTVVIDAEGAVRWNDQTWRSLSGSHARSRVRGGRARRSLA